MPLGGSFEPTIIKTEPINHDTAERIKIMARECFRIMRFLKMNSPCVKDGGCLKRMEAGKCSKANLKECYASLSRLSNGNKK